MEPAAKLDAEAIVTTIAALSGRIDERFPGSGLSAVGHELLSVSRTTQQRALEIARPRIGLRAGVAALLAVLIAVIVAAPINASMPNSFAVSELVQVSEAAINLLVLIGGAVFFLVTVERRMRRAQVLAAVHELRGLAHVIDMHQLAKDPQRILQPEYLVTPSSPVIAFDAFELSRYLDYCSEMFSLTGKLAALYGMQLDDPVIVAAVNDVETLTTGLSRKVWQKIVLLHSRSRITDDRIARVPN